MQVINDLASVFQLEVLNPQEELESCLFNINQLRRIRNRLKLLAQQKINQVLAEGETERDYFLQNAYLTGQLNLLTNLLIDHQEAESLIQQKNLSSSQASSSRTQGN